MFRCAVLTLALLPAGGVAAQRPNVVLVITDDQGYGDLSCHGNPQLATPNMDRLHAQSVRLTNFHVDPTCAPTRSALMTGKYSHRVGVWHTVMGRELLQSEETTLAERFAAAGYRTGICGKWHLGDDFPLRPQDQGFQEVLVHRGGGVGQTPDYWGNDYFDDVYHHDGHLEQQTGYCTDVWFDAAARYVENNQTAPFFLYVATNAPHAPYNVAKTYSQPFHEMGIPSPRAEFYGMLVNLDENLGKLRAKLDELKLTENTIFVFMTDNGTAAGHTSGGFNAGMRGSKGTVYEGGHRVPCFIHWPAGDLLGGRDVDFLTAHIDLTPTLCSLCGIEIDAADRLDGHDLSPWLHGDAPCMPPVPRVAEPLVVDQQRIDHPEKWRNFCVMTQHWRLTGRDELYDIIQDPSQTNNLAEQRPDAVAELTQAYEDWWQHVSDRHGKYTRVTLGNQAEPVTRLTCHDWHPLGREMPYSSQEALQKDPAANGNWAVHVETAGRYKFTLRRRPASHPATVAATRASVSVGDAHAEASVDPAAVTAELLLDLPAGPAMLTTEFTGTDGKKRGAYFCEVRLMEVD